VSATVEAATAVATSPDATPRGLERRVGVGAAWKLAGQIVMQGIRLVKVAVLARLLVAADYGAIAIALALFAPIGRRHGH